MKVPSDKYKRIIITLRLKYHRALQGNDTLHFNFSRLNLRHAYFKISRQGFYPPTNAASKGLNSKIQAVKAAARGFRNFETYRIAKLFHCGELQLHPQET